MPTARKLPSGSWRCQVFSHFEEIQQPDGTVKKKRIYKSFTCNDPKNSGKKKAEAMATAWALDKQTYVQSGSKSISNLIDDYISSKTNVLSPTTLTSYRSLKKNLFTDILDLKIDALENDAVQKWINSISVNHSPKTVRNAFGLLTATLDMYYPSKIIRVQLPQKKRTNIYTPSDRDIWALLDYFSDDIEMTKAIYLAAFGTLRRSEICALTSDDVSGRKIYVNKACVKINKDAWCIKTTKTLSSTRSVILPQFVIDLFPKNGKIVNVEHPDIISGRFIKAMRKLNLPHFRFHDLRHYSASIMHAINIPDQYIMQRGGWSSDRTLKDIYRGTLDDYQDKYTDMTIKYFETMQHEMQHKKK